MNNCKSLISNFASNRDSFNKSELWKWMQQNSSFSCNTMTCMLTQLIKSGELQRVSQGLYALASKRKQTFHAFVDKCEIDIYQLLKEQFPFANFCIYNGRSLSPLQHHLSENVATYIETERFAVDSVFDFLRSKNYIAWKNPDSDFSYLYIDLKNECYIVKPLVTESPVELQNGIRTPTIEKVLVDIRIDQCFDYLHGMEASRMWENAKDLYNINISRLRRYAKRRGLKIQDSEL